MKHIIFFLSTLLLLLFSSRGIENNTNLPVKKYKQNDNFEKQLNINDAYLIPSKIKDYETIKDNIDDFEYYILENNCTYLIADLGASNSSVYCEIKYISNCLNYNYFNEFGNELRYEPAVLEIIEIINNVPEKTFYKVSGEEFEKLKNNSTFIFDTDENYTRIIDSINFEIDYSFSYSKSNEKLAKNSESNLTYVKLLNTSRDAITYYAQNKYDTQYFKGEATYQVCEISSPSSIVNFIPRECFINPGDYAGICNEWGFYCKTTATILGQYNSKVLIFGIDQIKPDDMTCEYIKIYIILKNNYIAYDYKYAVVTDIENNLALCNPLYKESIVYGSPNNAATTIVKPNPGDENYNYKNDNGFSFSTTAFKMYCNHPENQPITIDVLKNATILAANFGIHLLSNLIPSTIGSFAFSTVGEYITESLINEAFKELDKDEEVFGNNYFSITNFNDYINYESMKNNNALIKDIIFKFDNKDYLISSYDHYIAYRVNFSASDNTSGYYPILNHHFELNIREGEFVSPRIALSWADYYIRNLVTKEETINRNNNEQHSLCFGIESNFSYRFNIYEDGQYYINLQNLQAGTHLEIYDSENTLQYTISSTDYDLIDVRGNTINSCNSFQSGIIHLKNGLYKIKIYRKIGNLYLSGSTSLMLAENNGEMGANAVSSKNSFIANISSGVKNIVSRFTPSESSLFYIYANNASSFSNDITLVVYDAYGKVLSSAVTSQRNVNGLLLTLPLESGKEYYIYSYQTNNFSSPYKISATGLKNLPYQGPSLSVTTNFTLFEANTNKLSFLIYRDEANIINFRFLSSLPDSVNIYKIDGFLVYSGHGNDLSTFEVTISEKQLYIVTISSVGINNVYATFAAEDIL